MANFEVFGPFPVPTTRATAGRLITPDDVRDFWAEITPASLADACGCYVFTLGTGRPVVPFYVGKSTREFKKEIFTPHKRLRYHEALATSRRRKPFMYLLRYPGRPSNKAKSAIAKLEKFLISTAAAANPDLVNVKGTRTPKWSIKGVLRARAGKPSAAAASFKGIMGL